MPHQGESELALVLDARLSEVGARPRSRGVPVLDFKSGNNTANDIKSILKYVAEHYDTKRNRH